MELYVIGIAEGALSNRTGSIAFSFMALFPLHYLFLILSHIPIEGFQQILKFVSEGVPLIRIMRLKTLL
jgi:membrane protein